MVRLSVVASIAFVVSHIAVCIAANMHAYLVEKHVVAGECVHSMYVVLVPSLDGYVV